MADNDSSLTCEGCKFFLENGVFGICRRYPAYESRHANNWCGEHSPLPKLEKPPVEPIKQEIEPKKRGRPARSQS